MDFEISQRFVTRDKEGSFSVIETVSGEGHAEVGKRLDPALSATLSYRADNNTGVLTLNPQALVAAQKVDVYWDGGSRRSMTVGTIAAESAPIDGGSGDNLPSQGTAVTVMVQETIPLYFDGDNVAAYSLGCRKARCTIILADALGAEILAFVLDVNQFAHWWSSSPDANPLAGSDVAQVFVTQESSTVPFADVEVSVLLADTSVPNTAPVVTCSGGTTAYTENGVALAIDAALTVTDEGSPYLVSGYAQITGNYQNGQDVLSVVNAFGITAGSFNTTTGRIDFTGNASDATWQAFLRTVKYANSSDNPNTSARTITFRVNDGVQDSNASTKSLSVAAVNDAPVVTTTVGPNTFTEGDPAMVIDSGVTVTDADSSNLVSGYAQITGNYQNGQDVLSVVNGFGITAGAFNTTTGKIDATGTTTPGNWQSFLRTVKYENTSEDPNTSGRTVTFIVNDGTSNSNSATKGVTVVAVNDAPNVSTSGGNASYTQDDPPVVIDDALLVTDDDDTNIESATVEITSGYQAGDVLAGVDGGGFTWSGGTGGTPLTCTVSASKDTWRDKLREVTFESDSGDDTQREITFKVHDGTDESAGATRLIDYTATGGALAFSTSEGDTTMLVDSQNYHIDDGLTCDNFDDVRKVVVEFDTGFIDDCDALTLDVSTFGTNGTGTIVGDTVVYESTTAESDTDWQTALRNAIFYIPTFNLKDHPTLDAVPRVMKFTVYDALDVELASDTKTVEVKFHKAYVDNATGNNGTAELDNSGLPYQDLAVAIAAIDTVQRSIEVVLLTNDTTYDGGRLNIDRLRTQGIMITGAFTIDFLPVMDQEDGSFVVLNGTTVGMIFRRNDTHDSSHPIAATVHGRVGGEDILEIDVSGRVGDDGGAGATGTPGTGNNGAPGGDGDPPTAGGSGDAYDGSGSTGDNAGGGYPGCHIYLHNVDSTGTARTDGGAGGEGGRGGDGGAATGGDGGNGGNSTAIVMQDGAPGGNGGDAISHGGNGGDGGAGGNAGNFYHSASTTFNLPITFANGGAGGVPGGGGDPGSVTGGNGGTGGNGAEGGSSGTNGSAGNTFGNVGGSGNGGSSGSGGNLIEI